MGVAFRMLGKEERCATFYLEILKVRDHLAAQVINKRILNIDLKQVGCMGLNFVHVAQDRDQRQAAVNTVMNLKLSKCGKFLDYLNHC
jgi:hypothetical protein